MILKKFLSIALPLCLVSVTFNSCSDADEANAQRDAGNSVIPSVEAVEARYGSLPLVERFSGNVKAENQVPIFPEISGRVEEASRFVPSVIVMGRSVLGRRVTHGMPRKVVSACTPPESVRVTADSDMSRRKSR